MLLVLRAWCAAACPQAALAVVRLANPELKASYYKGEFSTCYCCVLESHKRGTTTLILVGPNVVVQTQEGLRRTQPCTPLLFHRMPLLDQGRHNGIVVRHNVVPLLGCQQYYYLVGYHDASIKLLRPWAFHGGSSLTRSHSCIKTLISCSCGSSLGCLQ